MTHTRNITGIRAAAALSLGLSLVTFPAIGDTYELAAGASDTLTSETAETTTYDSMSIAGSLTVSGMKAVESTGGISVPGGTVTVSGANARLGYGRSLGTDWTLGFDAGSGEYGKVVIDGGKTDYAVGAKTFTIADGGNGVGGYIDFMEINGGGFTPYTLRNKSDLTARIKVSGTSRLTKPASNSNGMGIIAEGPFEILLADAAQLTIDFGNQRGSLNGGDSSSENSVDIVGSGDVTFKMSLNSNYPCRLRTGAKLNPAGSVTFGSSSSSTSAKFSLVGDDIFGANVSNVCVAATGASVTLDIAAGTTQTVRRLSFLRAGKDDTITGTGTLRLNAVDVGAVFAARMADDAALTIEKTGAQPVTAPRIANYPALKVLAGSYTITNDCFVSDLSGASGATLVADGCTVTIAGGNYALGGLELATANGGSFVKTGAGTARLYAPGSLGATLHVAEGNAVFSAIGLPQRYWRFTFTGMSGGAPAPVQLRGIYLFGTTGAWENSGLSASSYVTEVDTPALAVNKARYFVNSATNVVASSQSYEGIAKLYCLFSTADASNNRPALLSPLVDSGNPDSHLSIEFRLNDGGNPITGYNLCNGTGTGGGAYPSAWSVFASDDGESWTEIDSRSGETCTTASGKYYTYDGGAEYKANIMGKTAAELPGVVTEHFKFSGYKGDGLEADASKAIAIQVDNGASLDLTAFTVAPQKIDGIVFDVARGGGTIHGGSIAAAGVLEIVDAGGTLNYGQPLPLVFDGVTGTENFTNWTVTVNGVAVKRELVFRDGALAFNNPGLVIFVR